MRKYKKVKEKLLFIPFSLISCYNLATKQLPSTSFVKNMRDFSFFDTLQPPPQCQKVMIFKRNFKFNSGFNNRENLVIFGLVTAYRNQKSCRGRIFNFCFFFLKILPFFGPNNSQSWKTSIFWNLEGQNFKNGRKNQISDFYNIFVFKICD